jgi:hypothetical protein
MTEKLVKPRRLTVEWLIQNDLPVWVKNQTRPKGQVVLTVIHPGSGRASSIKIPRTHLPICLTDHAPPESLRQSQDLLALHRKGILDLVWPEDAEGELEREGVTHEMQRLQISQFSAHSTFVSDRVAEDQKMADRANTTRSALDGNFTTEQDQMQQITPRVIQFLEQYKSGDLSIKALLSELKTLESELSPTDCSYLIANGPEGQIKQFAQKLLAGLQTSPPPEPAATMPSDKASEYDIRDDPDDMTEEERAAEEAREAIARAQQDGVDSNARNVAMDRVQQRLDKR